MSRGVFETQDSFFGSLLMLSVIFSLLIGVALAGQKGSDKAKKECEAKGGVYWQPYKSEPKCVKEIISD